MEIHHGAEAGLRQRRGFVGYLVAQPTGTLLAAASKRTLRNKPRD
jgi:hypothetical protein